MNNSIDWDKIFGGEGESTNWDIPENPIHLNDESEESIFPKSVGCEPDIARVESVIGDGLTVDSISDQQLTVDSNPPASIPQEKKRKREKIRDRMKILKSLMPCNEKKMKTDELLLKECCKYTKYLQAQVKALQSMPQHSSASSSDSGQGSDSDFLGKVSRNQMLQFLVSSPLSQSVQYSDEQCIYSEEQLSAAGRAFDSPTSAHNG